MGAGIGGWFGCVKDMAGCPRGVVGARLPAILRSDGKTTGSGRPVHEGARAPGFHGGAFISGTDLIGRDYASAALFTGESLGSAETFAYCGARHLLLIHRPVDSYQWYKRAAV